MSFSAFAVCLFPMPFQLELLTGIEGGLDEEKGRRKDDDD
jgi:hypothetical protein